MTDWKALAQARGLNLPDKELDRISAPLAALEAAFRPLVAGLTPGQEPDTELRLGGEDR
jgi:hypothetical protein